MWYSKLSIGHLKGTFVKNVLRCPISSVCIMKGDGRADESDKTGDSGMGSGSGATKYGPIEEWKEAIQNPPPGMCIYFYYC